MIRMRVEIHSAGGTQTKAHLAAQDIRIVRGPNHLEDGRHQIDHVGIGKNGKLEGFIHDHREGYGFKASSADLSDAGAQLDFQVNGR